MAFLETPRLDPLITEGCHSETQWRRDKVYTTGGRLRQSFKWTNPKQVLNLAYRPHTPADYHALMALFMVVNGNQLEGFRAKDWSYYTLDETNSTLTWISGETWQIQRLHTFGAYTFKRDITKPVDGTVTIYNEVMTDAGATIDYATGIATIPGSADGDVYTASGEFDIPVTFVSDEWVGDFLGTSTELWIATKPLLVEEIRL